MVGEADIFLAVVGDLEGWMISSFTVHANAQAECWNCSIVFVVMYSGGCQGKRVGAGGWEGIARVRL